MDNDIDHAPIFFRYRFRFENGTEKQFQINLDPVTLRLVQTPPTPLPEWTKLECERCPNCPLNPRTNPHCPVAVGLIDVIDFLKNILSIDKTHLTIETNERNYSKETAVANAASSMIGIYMVTCDCPILDKLRPMARFHLPFATPEETVYRALSTYLLAQYLLYQKKRKPDWDLKNLNKTYEEVNKINRAFSDRLRQINPEDSSLNAIIRLDCFAHAINFTISAKNIVDLETPFRVYLQ